MNKVTNNGTKRMKRQTLYERLAEKHGCSVEYVRSIRTKRREPKRKKGFAVKAELEEIFGEL